MSLILDSLQKSIASLERAVKVAHSDMEGLSEDIQETIRAGVIQNFEVAYEQCWKFMQRWIRLNVFPSQAEFLQTKKELFRIAARYGLISDPMPWYDYSQARNLTSHTYSESYAVDVFEAAEAFVKDAKVLLKNLEAKND